MRARGVGRPKSDGGRDAEKPSKPLKSIVPESGADRAPGGPLGTGKNPISGGWMKPRLDLL